VVKPSMKPLSKLPQSDSEMSPRSKSSRQKHVLLSNSPKSNQQGKQLSLPYPHLKVVKEELKFKEQMDD
jgi:hypothetical protein